MTLIELIVGLIIIGVLMWAINLYIPMETRIKQILNVVVVIVIILWILRGFGVIGVLNERI